ncbi:MAG: tetratricopeptide repeat protein, partial [Nitrosomonas sp.]|nr:tetratricopeptide repeat protein [Nitrosomonas sp.]
MKKIIAIILCGLLILTLPILAAPEHRTITSAQITGVWQAASQVSNTPDDLKLQQQKLDFFKERLDGQDKRISDLAFLLSLSLACFGVLMTVIVVFFSLRSTKEAVLAAKEEARTEVTVQSQNIIGNWLDNDGQSLLFQKVESTLQPEIDKALLEIHNATNSVLDGLMEEKREAHDHNTKTKQLIENLNDIVTRSVDKDQPLSEEQKNTVDKAAKDLESKPPKEYEFKDWLMLGVRAFQSGKYEIAVEYFSKAVEVSSEPVQLAKALFNKAITLGQLERSEEAIAVYDEVVKRFGESTELSLREQVAKALLNKGARLSQLERSEEEIAVYDEVVKRFGEAK